MPADADFHKSEYEALRQETNTHQTFANAIIGLEVTALGVGISLGGKSPYVLAGLAIVTAMLWVSYLDHLEGMFRIAAYIILELRPRVSGICTHPVLSWEIFLRRERIEPQTDVLLEPSVLLPAEKFKEPALGLTYLSIFFAATPPTFIGMYIYETLDKQHAYPVMYL